MRYERTMRYLFRLRDELEGNASSLSESDVSRLMRLYRGAKTRKASDVENVEREIASTEGDAERGGAVRSGATVGSGSESAGSVGSPLPPPPPAPAPLRDWNFESDEAETVEMLNSIEVLSATIISRLQERNAGPSAS